MNALAHLHSRLRPLLDREAAIHRRRAFIFLWAALAVTALLFALILPTIPWFLGILLVAIIGAPAIAAATRAFEPSPRALVRRLEREHPDLQSLLTTAIEQTPSPDSPDGSLNLLQTRVVKQAADEILRRDLPETDNEQTERRAGLFLRLAFCTFILALLFLLIRSDALRTGVTLTSPTAPNPATATATPDASEAQTTVTVTPGSIDIERGSRVPVSARFAGRIPTEATLITHPDEPEDAEQPQSIRLPMARNLDDPLFGAVLSEVLADTPYRIEWDTGTSSDGASTNFLLTTYELPRLLQADATITPPPGTSIPPETLPDTRRLTLFQGSELQLVLRLNKPVATALFEPQPQKPKKAKPGQPPPEPPPLPDPIAFETIGTNDTIRLHTWIPAHTASYRLHLTDPEGRANRKPPLFSIKVRPNAPPNIQITFPTRDLEVTPIQEVDVSATVWDDGGLTAAGTTITFDGTSTEIPLATEHLAADKKQSLSTLLDFETLGAEPNDLLSYFFWAEDTGPDGAPRRVASDIFFAEVRHFEEIYQQMPPMPAGSMPPPEGEQMKDAEELIKSQKEIITSTWNVQRRRPDHPKTPDDLTLLSESQTAIREATTTLAAELSDANMLQAIESATTDMERASEQLDAPDTQAALVHEQSALDHLLDLRSRMFQVMRQQQSEQQAQSAASQRRQNQLMQMDMKDQEDRYETQRFAEEQQSDQARQEQQEDLQMLNRLNELAQRQEDAAEKIKELEAALAAAATDEEKEERLRELKRLTDEQRDLLADIDELQQQMNEEQNQERTAEAREQLAETRDNAQQASEDLAEGKLSQAANAATRASDDLEELAEDFREQTSARFADEMRDLRRDARELADTQQDIAGQIEEQREVSQGTIADSLRNQEISQALTDQEQDLDDLLERLGDLSEDAAESEPLLSSKTYDAVRDTETKGTREALEDASNLSRWNQLSRAADRESDAREQIEDLVRDVEQAAKSILGDETEALRMASRQVERLLGDAEQDRSANQPGKSQPGNTDVPVDQPGKGHPGKTDVPVDQPGEGQPANTDAPVDQPGEGQARNTDAPVGQPGKGQPGNTDVPIDQPGKSQPANTDVPVDQPGKSQPGNTDVPVGQPGKGQPGNTDAPVGQPGEGQPWNTDASVGQSGKGKPGQGSPSSFFEQWSETDAPNNASGGGGPNDNARPFTGDDFRDWSDRLRSVEEALDDPKLRREAAAIRNRARELRREAKRHSKEPNWDLVGDRVVEPLRLLQQQINEELVRRQPDDTLVPLDRDPVAPDYEDLVRQYHEALSTKK